MSLRPTSVGAIAKPPPRPLEAGGKAEPKEHRPVYFAESDGYVDCPIYDRYALPAGATPRRPGIVEEFARPPLSIQATSCSSTRPATC